jgi:hypothetical protein
VTACPRRQSTAPGLSHVPPYFPLLSRLVSHSSFAARVCGKPGSTPGQIVTVHVADQTITIDLDDKDSRTVRRTTAQPVRSIKAAQSREDSRVS